MKGRIDRVCLMLVGWCVLFASLVAATASGSVQNATLPDVSGIPAVNPIPYSPVSIAEVNVTFIRLCPACHQEAGKALAQTLAPAADLTDPSRWKFGTDDAHSFRSIRDGAGAAMPVFGNQLKSEQIWDLVNFVRSIGPASLQPNRKP